MPLGANITLVPITGNFVDFQGNAISGQIKLTVSETLTDSVDNQIIVPSTKTIQLDTNGSFSSSFPATNDPDVEPAPYTIRVEESFPFGRTYTISLPYTTAGSLDFADISPDPTIAVTYYGLATRVPWDALLVLINTLDASIDQSTSSYLLSGVYSYIPFAYASYTSLASAFATYTALNAGPYPVTGSAFNGFLTDAQNAATSASTSATTATTLTTNLLNSFLLLGG
jgi:hypothetical protein